MPSTVINKHKNMLIIGKGANDFALKEVALATNYDKVLEQYGDSDLTKAYKAAADIGAPYIYLMNVQKDQDYFDVLEVLKQNDFTYIVFCSLVLSDTFQKVNDGGQIHYFFSYYLGYMGLNHRSVILVTDKHASLYEDIDSYLDEMNSIQTQFVNHCSSRANLQNIIFVANNLEDYEKANVPLAAALCASDIADYPTSDSFGKAIFDIDSWDNPGDMAYFKSHTVRETTIENLLNFDQDYEPEKIVYVNRILKCLAREMDFTEFKGTLYSAYQKDLFEQKLTKYMDSVIGTLIKDYQIESINVYKDDPGTVIMLARIVVLPLNCLETCTIEEGVTLQ